MKKLLLSFTAVFSMLLANAQLNLPNTTNTGQTVEWNVQQTKAAGDSCGFYWNNHLAINKTSTLFFEALRSGNFTESNTYNGRAQRFDCPQPMEIAGIQFYGFETNPALDSIMAITTLYDYDSVNDTVGAILATDTVYVHHQSFTPVLPDLEVNSFFDSPISVNNDYIIAIHTPTDDSLKILTSDFFGGDGQGEGNSYLLYDNPNFPGFQGWYNAINLFGAGYDGDYLISPNIKFDLNDGFTLSNDTLCPNIVSGACVSYAQLSAQSNAQYSAQHNTPDQHIVWYWGDGFQNTNLLNACHTYTDPGDYTIELYDTLFRHNVNSPTCVGAITANIHIIDTVSANFTFVQNNTSIIFTNTSTAADSIWWNFGDGTMGNDSLITTHVYDSIQSYDVWLFAYNECGADSIMMTVTTDDVGYENLDMKIRIFPNPANEKLQITGVSNGSKVELINLLGQIISTQFSNDTSLNIALSDHPEGSYFIRITENEQQITRKLIIQH